MTQRGPFGRPGSGKDEVELSTAREFAKSMAAVFDTPIAEVNKGADPPDIFARVGSRQVAVELVELLDQEVRAKRARLRPGYPGEFDDQQWSRDTFEESVNVLLDKKQEKYARTGFVADALVIHSGELWLTWQMSAQWLGEVEFTPRANLRSAYLLLFYDPSYGHTHWPLFAIYGGLGA